MATYYNSNTRSKFDQKTLGLPSFANRYLDYLRIEKNAAPRTIFNYAVSIRVFLRWVHSLTIGTPEQSADKLDISDMGIDEVSTLTASDIYAFLSYCDAVRGNSPKSRAAKLVAINSFMEYLRKRDESNTVIDNPAKDISAPKKEHKLPQYLSLYEAKKLLMAVSGEAASRDYCMIVWLLSCGMRLTELVSVNLDDIKDGKLRIHGKGRKERMLQLNELCMSAFETYLNDRSQYKRIVDEKAVFISPRYGTRLTGRRVEQIIDKYLEQTLMKQRGISVHTLRHSAASILYSDGTGIKELQQILGHSDISTTGIYMHTNDSKVAQALSRMSVLLAPDNAEP